jgi:hypothetical protein
MIGVLVVSIATSIVTVIRRSNRLQELGSDELVFADGWVAGIGLAFVGMAFLCGISWMMWQYRAHANLAAMGATAFRPGAIWWWIVPVAGLVVPFLAVSELARAGEDRPALRRWWWASLLLFSVTAGLSAGLVPWADLDLAWLEAISIATSLVGIGAAVLAMGVVAVVDRGIDARRAAMGWSPGWSAWTAPMKLAWGLAAAALAVVGGLGLGVVLPELTVALSQDGSRRATDFSIGTCFNDDQSGFPEVACTAPHRAETFALLSHPDLSIYPGSEEIEAWAEPLCYARFKSYTGVAYEDSTLDFGYLYPTAGSWAAGDREVVCYVFDPEGDLTGPVRSGGGAA